jgi:hypothetical protein
LFNPEVFFKISTLLLPTLNFKSTSGTRLLVFPSKTMSFGGVYNLFQMKIFQLIQKIEEHLFLQLVEWTHLVLMSNLMENQVQCH